MKRPALLLLLAVILVPAAPGPALCAPETTADSSPTAPKDGNVPDLIFAVSPKSFHGIAWGTPLGDIKDMTVVERNGPASYAKIPGMTPRLGDVPVDEIVYAFCNDRFAGSMSTFQGRDRFTAIKDLLTSRHGQPAAPEGATDNAGWPLGDVLILLEFDPVLKVGTLNYVNVPEYAPCTAPTGAPSPGATP